MLQYEFLLARIGFDNIENEPPQGCFLTFSHPQDFEVQVYNIAGPFFASLLKRCAHGFLTQHDQTATTEMRQTKGSICWV